MPPTRPRSCVCGSQLTQHALVVMAEPLGDAAQVGDDVGVRDHDAFAAGGRTRRVLQVRDVIAPSSTGACHARASSACVLLRRQADAASRARAGSCGRSRASSMSPSSAGLRALTSSTMPRNCIDEAFRRGTGSGTATTPAYRQPKNALRNSSPGGYSSIDALAGAPSPCRRAAIARACRCQFCRRTARPCRPRPSPKEVQAGALGLLLQRALDAVRRRASSACHVGAGLIGRIPSLARRAGAAHVEHAARADRQERVLPTLAGPQCPVLLQQPPRSAAKLRRSRASSLKTNVAHRHVAAGGVRDAHRQAPVRTSGTGNCSRKQSST